MNLANFLSYTYPLPTSEDIKKWDFVASESGLDTFSLMENAGRAALEVLHFNFNKLKGKKALVLMGNGNNGGDAASLARNLNDYGVSCKIISYKKISEFSPVCIKHLQLAIYNGSQFYTLSNEISLENPEVWLKYILSIFKCFPDIIIDGLLGTGFKGELKENILNLVKAVNFLSSTVSSIFTLSLDIPSGLNSDTGLPCPVAIKANATANFAAIKIGEIFSAAKQWTGNLYICNIGIPQKISYDYPPQNWMLDGHSLKCLPKPCANDSHKNFYGHVIIIGGKGGLSGAAHLAASAALCSGSGLVTVVSPKASSPIIKNGLPEAMVFGLGNTNNQLWPKDIDDNLANLLDKADSIVIGPGMGRSDDSASFLHAILRLNLKKPLILDADALILLSQNRKWFDYIVSPAIITPHPGEAAALLGCSTAEIQKNRLESLSHLCNRNSAISIILKGSNTLIGQLNLPSFVCPYDVPQIAIAGAGDVLSGLLGSMTANKIFYDMPFIQLAALAVIIHALAGKICAQYFPHRGLRASLLAKTIPQVYEMYNNSPSTTGYAKRLPWPPSD